MEQWVIFAITLVVLSAAYIALFIWGRRKRREFDEQYDAAKRRYEVFVLQKKTVREKPPTGMFRFFKFKTYQIVGRVNISQAVKGMEISRMQTVTFQTTKAEYKKIEPNHRYKMDVAGTFIGNVVAPNPQKKKKGKRRE